MKLNPRQRGITAAVILGVVIIALVSPHVFGTDARHLSAYSDDAEDLSRLRGILGEIGRPTAILSTAHALKDMTAPEDTLLVIIGVERAYDASEARAVLDFLQAGGNVLLADEQSFGSAIASAAGFAFSSQRVLDTRNHLGDPGLVVTDIALGAESFRVLFNEPSRLLPPRAGGFETLASTSSAVYPDGSYADINGDEQVDISDEAGPFVLVARAQVGEGTLVLVSDTGPFMNRQLEVAEYQNEAFIRALTRTLVQGDAYIVIDESRHAPPAGGALWDNSMRALGRLTQGGTAPILIVILFAAAFVAWRFTRPTEDWSHHAHNVGLELQVAPGVRPDADRAQRFARRRISEKYNIPMEQVQAMTAEELAAATGERALSEVAAGKSRADPASFFHSTPTTEPSP